MAGKSLHRKPAPIEVIM